MRAPCARALVALGGRWKKHISDAASPLWSNGLQPNPNPSGKYFTRIIGGFGVQKAIFWSIFNFYPKPWGNDPISLMFVWIGWNYQLDKGWDGRWGTFFTVHFFVKGSTKVVVEGSLQYFLPWKGAHDTHVWCFTKKCLCHQWPPPKKKQETARWKTFWMDSHVDFSIGFSHISTLKTTSTIHHVFFLVIPRGLTHFHWTNFWSHKVFGTITSTDLGRPRCSYLVILGVRK